MVIEVIAPLASHMLAAHLIAGLTGLEVLHCRTFVGVVELQPTRLLEDGLREHMATRAAAAAATALAFPHPPPPLAHPPLSAAGRSAFSALFGAGASLSNAIPGRCAVACFTSWHCTNCENPYTTPRGHVLFAEHFVHSHGRDNAGDGTLSKAKQSLCHRFPSVSRLAVGSDQAESNGQCEGMLS